MEQARTQAVLSYAFSIMDANREKESSTKEDNKLSRGRYWWEETETEQMQIFVRAQDRDGAKLAIHRMLTKTAKFKS